MEANVNVTAIFAQHFVPIHNLSFCEKLICKQTIKGLDIRYFHAHYSSASQIAQWYSLPHNPWIGGSNPGGNYASFQCLVE